jgi:hypothetical protein
MMSKPPKPETIAAELTVPERVLLFCLASNNDWVKAGVTHAIAQHCSSGTWLSAAPGRILF